MKKEYNMYILLACFIFLSIPQSATANHLSSDDPINIQVPSLVSQVKLDGIITSSAEWSDTLETHLSLGCIVSETCVTAFMTKANAAIWVKHDADWLYLLYRIDWNRPLVSWQEASIWYFWSQDGSRPWQYADFGGVGLSMGGKPSTSDHWMKGQGSMEGGGTWLSDTNVPQGANDVQGWATYDGKELWFEFRKRLNSGDCCDWNFTADRTYGIEGVDGLLYIVFGYSEPNVSYAATVRFSIANAITATETSGSTTNAMSSITTSKATSYTSSVQTTAQPTFLIGNTFSSYMMAGIVIIASVSSVIVVVKRRKAVPEARSTKPKTEPEPTLPSTVPAINEQQTVTETLTKLASVEKPLAALSERVAARALSPSSPEPPAQEEEAIISTGYADLDISLSGGVPERFAVLFAAPSYDERDLLLRRIIETNLASENPTFFISGDARKTEDLLRRYSHDFFVFCPQADKITPARPNLKKIGGVENLSEFNISVTMAIRSTPVKQGVRKIMIIDTLSDVLLHHRLLTTRKWLSDFLTRRKAEGFTIFATFNPLIAPREEVQTILDSFDGVIEIYEKDLKERSRRFLLIRKMYGRRYSETELMLDKDKLF